jgi:hypothetical protein
MTALYVPVARVLFAAALLAATQAQAQVYKCVDAKGKTVYSQNPCPAGATTSVLGAKPPPPAEPAAKDPAAKADPSKPAAKADPSKPATTAEKDQEFRKRQQEREEAEKKAADQAAEAKRKQDDCRRAREQVAQYDIGGRISRFDDKGERYFLDEAQVAQEKAKWQAQADQVCR